MIIMTSMSKTGRMIFKMLKSNEFTLEDVAKAVKMKPKEVEEIFNEWCGGQFVFPGVYLVGGHVDAIIDALDKHDKVLVVGDEGTGKSINALTVCRKLKGRKVRSVEKLDELLCFEYDGLIFLDDIDCFDKSSINSIAKFLSDKTKKILFTSTKTKKLEGFFTYTIKPLNSKEMNMLKKSKGWVVPPGVSNLKDISKFNTLNGGIAKQVKNPSLIERVSRLVAGEELENVSMIELEQVFRNALAIDPVKTGKNIDAFLGAWLAFHNGGDVSPCIWVFPKVTGSQAVLFRKE